MWSPFFGLLIGNSRATHVIPDMSRILSSLRYPLIQAPMAFAHDTELTLAVSKTGALGSLAGAMYDAAGLGKPPGMVGADEPTGSLDSQSQEKVLEVFKNLAQTGKTVLIVTHNPEVAEYADVIIKMKDGEVVEEVKK